MKNLPANFPESLEPLLDDIEVTTVREGLVDAYVPLDLIITEDVPVEEGHVDELIAHFQREAQQPGRRTGQISPASLSHIATEDRLPITDGFHRTATIKAVGENILYSTIRPDSTWEDVMDLRIIATTSHRGVRFARVIEWVQGSWKLTPWADDIDALQAFTLAQNQKLTGVKLGLNEETVAEIREWALRKCQQWDLSVASVRNSLNSANVVDPEIIREAREGKGRGGEKGIITSSQVRVIGAALPKNYPFQRLVAQLAKDEGLPAPQVQTLASLIAPATTIEQARKLIDSGVWRQLSKPVRPTGRPTIDRIVRDHRTELSNGDLRNMITEAEIRLAGLALENTVVKGKYLVPPLDAAPTEEPMRVAGYTMPEKVNRTRELENIIDTLESLRPASVKHLSQAFTEELSERIFDIVKMRIVSDVEDGALAYVELDKSTLTKLLTAGLNHQARYGEENLQQPLDIDKDTQVVSLADINSSHLTPFAIDSVLPELPLKERRAFILQTFYRLNDFALAQFVHVAPVELNHILSGVKEKLTPKEISRRQSATSRKESRRQDVELDAEEAQRVGLTETELEILALITLGFSNEQMAKARIISPETVKSHVKHILEKTQTPNRSALVAFAYEHGLVQRTNGQPIETAEL